MTGTQRTLTTLFVMFVVVWGTILSLGHYVWTQTEIPEVIRDFAILTVAHHKAGEAIPFQADYDREETWLYRRIETNSVFLVESAYRVGPAFAYEKAIMSERYPIMLSWEHMGADRSFHLLGWAYVGRPVIGINERMLSDPSWNDLRLFYEVLIHEMCHIQRYKFSGGEVKELEARSVSATVEITAGLTIRAVDPILEQSFWYQIEGLAADSLRVRFHEAKLDWLLDAIFDIFYRDAQEQLRYKKSVRYWKYNQTGLWEIIRDYGQYPWEEFILPGILGYPMDVRDIEMYDSYWGYGQGRFITYRMPIDDVPDLLGDFLVWLISVTTEVPND